MEQRASFVVVGVHAGLGAGLSAGGDPPSPDPALQEKLARLKVDGCL